METILFVPRKVPLNRSSFQSCPTCQNQVSVTATSCPKCGHTFKQAGGVNLKDPVHIAGLIVCVIIIVLVVIYILAVTVGI
jgi:predicted amidophosphoribosyltransferase